MITFSKLGKKGNLGNQLFQIASTISLAEKYGHNYFFPKWDYSEYFKNNFPVFEKDESFEIIKEKSFSYYQWDLGKNNYDLDGWLQSEKYFNKESVRNFFKFESFSEQLFLDYHFLFSKKTILVSIRRGDFIRHPYYCQLSHLYYFKAITRNFSNWKDFNILFTSDDILYCKKHFSFIKNSYYLENLSAIEQLVLGSKCDHFIISNSTFSWWIAWLGEKEDSKVIRPIKNFRGKFAEKNDDSDYFPERWISFNDKIYWVEWKYFSFLLRGFITEISCDLRSLYRRSKKEIKQKIKSILFKK